MRMNNANPGEDQPRGGPPSPRRKVHCMQCGWLADLSRHSNDGGSLTADGAGGIIIQVDGGDGLFAGDQQYRNGAGCPMCFSKNFSLI